MITRYDKQLYLNRATKITADIDIEYFNHKTILLRGATGLIGTMFIDALLSNPNYHGLIIANTLNVRAAQARFSKWLYDGRLSFVEGNIKEPLHVARTVDIVIHAASYTDPKNYAAHPIDTMLINFLGIKNMLDIAARNKAKVLVMSTTEVYGESKQTTPLDETSYGYIDPLQLRSAYNIAKQAAETLAIAYSEEHGLHVTIARFSRVYGPTMLKGDTKALSQFIKNTLREEAVLLKSAGSQQYSYIYVADAVRAMLFLLEHGESNEAYNITNDEVYSLKEIAQLVAKIGEVDFKQEIQDEYKGKGYSKATFAILDTSKIKAIGFKTEVNLKEGLEETIQILRSEY